MLDKIALKTVTPLTVYCIEGTPPNLGKLISRLLNWLQENGAVTASDPIALFHATPDQATSVEDIRCEACVEAYPPPNPDEQITQKTLPEVKVAFTSYEGPQSAEQEISIVMKISNWMSENGYKQAGPVRQIYHRVWLEDDKPFVSMETQIPVE
jgi:effector-binding domain-containing protein